MSTQVYPGDPDWPANFGGCRIQAQYVDFLANPIEGEIVFKAAPSVVLSVSTKRVLISRPLRFSLDASGAIDILVPASNDPDVNPTGWTYSVTEEFVGLQGRSYDIEAPLGEVINLVNVAPAAPSVGGAIIVGPAGPSAYDVAVLNGFVGTETEWLASLKGQPGTAGGFLPPIHNQTSASASWSIVHNLGRYPMVSVIDDNGAIVIADVEYVSLNQVAIYFGTPQTGKVILT